MSDGDNASRRSAVTGRAAHSSCAAHSHNLQRPVQGAHRAPMKHRAGK